MRAPPAATKRGARVASASDLSETEQDLLRHLQNGYELETDTLGGDVLLRQPKGKEVIRALSATRNTVKALEDRGLIVSAKGDDPLRIIFRLNGSTSSKKFGTKRPARLPRKRTRNR